MSEQRRRQPLVSVVIAAHNRQATIAETLASVTNGTYRNVEIIVVDDGSTDATAATVEPLLKHDPRIRLLRRDWGGVAAAYSAGLREARGDYVAYLDSDDLWHPAKLEKQVALAQAEPELAFIYTFLRMIDANGRVMHDVPEQRYPRRALCRSLYESLAGANSSALMRRSVLIEADKHTKGLHSRQDLMLQLGIFANHPIGFVPEYLAAYRYTHGSLSADAGAMLESWRIVAGRAAGIVPRYAGRVCRWAEARQYSELAEAFVWQRKYAAAAKLSLAALWRDPVRTTLNFLHSLERLATRARRRQKSETEGPRFDACDPLLQIRPKEIFAGTAGRLVEALDQRRLRMISAFDQRIGDAGRHG